MKSRLRVCLALLAVAGLVLTPYFALSLALHTYLIASRPDDAEFAVDGAEVDASGRFTYRGFYGPDDIECRFKSGIVRRVRVFPRFSDDNSSSLFIHENGDVVSFGDLRFKRLEPTEAEQPSASEGLHLYPSFPTRLEGPAISAALPRSFESDASMEEWAKHRTAPPSVALAQWNDTRLCLVSVSPSNESSAVFVLVFASRGNEWKLVYADLTGYPMLSGPYGELEIEIDDAKQLVVRSKAGVHATISFKDGLQAVEAAFAE